MTNEEEERIERLLGEPYWLIDFLPCRVPADGPGQFFAVEQYYRAGPQYKIFRRKIADVLIKLGCYADFRVFFGGEALEDPAPETLAARIEDCREPLMILVRPGDCLITLDRDDLYATVYAPTEALRSLLAPLSAAEGLFFRRPDGRAGED